MAARDEIRLISRVARLYYESGLKQPEIASRLGLSQVKVSRLLKQALERDIVRITVRTPVGVNAETEEALEKRFDLQEAVVVETSTDDEAQLMRDLGQAAAFHLERTIRPGEVIGISSWSASLLATVNAMHPVASRRDITVVQLLGGVGSPAAEMHATELVRRLAEMLQGEPVLLPVPGVVGSVEARDVLLADPHVRRAMDLYPTVTLALVGIGTVEPSDLLARSGNVFSAQELGSAQRAGAVGDVCLRFFDECGVPVATTLDDRVVGLRLDELAAVPRAVAVAGGTRKARAIVGALRGGLVSHLVTDQRTAELILRM